LLKTSTRWWCRQ